MSLFNLDQEEILSFFAVLVRFSVLFAVLPFIGDRVVPTPVKILLSLAVSVALFPALVANGRIHPGDAIVWGASASGIIGTIALEVIFALIMGFTARMAFETITFGGNLVGNFMGFAAASTYDPHQESQTQVVAQIQMTIAMLVFLVLDGHHLMLRASLDSYRIVGVGGLSLFKGSAFSGAVSQKLIAMSADVIRFGIEIAAPVAISLFAVNVVFGILAKAMPQLNILMLSFGVSALVGLLVMFLSVPEFQGVAGNIVGKIGESMEAMMVTLAKGK